MTFAHPLLLVLLLLPAAFLAYEWRRTTRRLSLVLKAASLMAIAAALAEPVLRMPETKTGVVVLADTSASISDKDLEREQALVKGMAQAVGHNWMRVIPFARRARDLKPQEVQGGWRLERTADENGKSTDLEAAIREGISAVPNGRIPRLVLISDGKENEGSSARAIAQVERLGIPVDTFSLSGRPENGLRILSTSVPRVAYASEEIPVDLTIQSPKTARATVAISAEGKPLGENPVNLTQGVNQVHVRGRINSSGVTTMTGRLSLDDGSAVDFEQAINLKRAQVVYISQDPPGSDANLLAALGQAQFDVKTDSRLLDTPLSDTQLVILNNLNLLNLSQTEKNNLEEYVKNGGGLLLIGGEKQVYKEQKQADALDRILPADLAPPKSPEGTVVGLIIDKSSSMEGRKIDLARLSAIGVVDHLRPMDSIGVLIFDNSYQWAVPIRHAEDKSLIKRLISGITPDGGTQIAPALTEAYRRIMAAHATYKHIVLLTDGISEEGDSLDLAREAQAHQVTISTVGLGQDVNRSYLERVASFSGGKSYFLNEPQGLEQILLKDVMEYTGSTAVERALKPLVREKAEVLEGTDIESAPALKGYTRFTAKPTAETVLSIDSERNDPLYVRWQYGLGRTAVFTSDAKSRWASDWIHWQGFDKFWINVTRDLLPHATGSDASTALDAANNDLVVNYHLAAGTKEPEKIPQIFVLGPDGFQKPIEVARTAAGTYEGRLHIGELRGLFRIRPLADSAAFPEVGFYRQQEEMLDYGSNAALLRQIATLTGGRFNPEAQDVFRSGGRRIPTVWRLWPGLLAAAIVLTIVELLVRKWRGIFQSFNSRWATVSK
jgi:Ca-activated chloride channel homolog